MNRTTRLKMVQIPELETLYEFDSLGGRPMYADVPMTHETNIPDVDKAKEEAIRVASEFYNELTQSLNDEEKARTAADEQLQKDFAEALGKISELEANKLSIDNLLEGDNVTITREGEGGETKLTISSEGGGEGGGGAKIDDEDWSTLWQ